MSKSLTEVEKDLEKFRGIWENTEEMLHVRIQT